MKDCFCNWSSSQQRAKKVQYESTIQKLISSITYKSYVGNVTNSDKHSRIFEQFVTFYYFLSFHHFFQVLLFPILPLFVSIYERLNLAKKLVGAAVVNIFTSLQMQWRGYEYTKDCSSDWSLSQQRAKKKKKSMNLQHKKIISSIAYKSYVSNVTNSDKHSRIFRESIAYFLIIFFRFYYFLSYLYQF